MKQSCEFKKYKEDKFKKNKKGIDTVYITVYTVHKIYKKGSEIYGWKFGD